MKKENIGHNEMIVTGEDVNHIRNVLRKEAGDRLVLCDGCGTDYITVIVECGKDSIQTRIVETRENKNEPPLRVVLFQAVPKSDKMEFVIQKCVELGISAICPVCSSYTVVRFDGKVGRRKLDRWRRISLEAAKQCNRGKVPPVSEPVDFSKALEMAVKLDKVVMPYVGEHKTGLREAIAGAGYGSIGVFTGPEGGFSEEEAAAARQKGVTTVSLGPRILRTETAGIATVAVIMYETGGLG